MTLKRMAAPIAAAALLAVAAAGCGSSSSASPSKDAGAKATGAKAPAGGPVAVELSEWKVRPSVARARSGKVTFAVKNVGTMTHELVVLKTAARAATLGKGARVPETHNVGETGDLARGASKDVTIALAPGHYSLVCNLPGHYADGMHTDFTVQ